MILPPRIAAFFATLAGRLVLVVLAILAAWWLVSALTGGSRAKIEAKLGKNQVEAATQSGSDAVNTVGAQGANEDAIDALTRRNDDAIRNAEGAGAPVAGGVNDAGLRALCQRAAYRERPQCLQFTPAR